MGSGKSTVAAALAGLMGRRSVDLDQVIEERVQMTIAEIFGERGEEEFRRLEAAVLAEQLDQPSVIALGGGATLDGGSWRLIKERAISVWLEAPLDELWARVEGRAGRPLAEDRSSFERRYLERLPRYADADHRVDATRAPAAIAEEVARLCAE